MTEVLLRSIRRSHLARCHRLSAYSPNNRRWRCPRNSGFPFRRGIPIINDDSEFECKFTMIFFISVTTWLYPNGSTNLTFQVKFHIKRIAMISRCRMQRKNERMWVDDFVELQFYLSLWTESSCFRDYLSATEADTVVCFLFIKFNCLLTDTKINELCAVAFRKSQIFCPVELPVVHRITLLIAMLSTEFDKHKCRSFVQLNLFDYLCCIIFTANLARNLVPTHACVQCHCTALNIPNHCHCNVFL